MGPPTNPKASPPFMPLWTPELISSIPVTFTAWVITNCCYPVSSKSVGKKRSSASNSARLRAPDRSFIGLDMRPAAVKNFLAYSLKRLGTDYIDLYQPCRVDRSVPIEDTIGAMVEMKERGYIRYLGISEAGPEMIRRAHAVHPISALQIEYAVVTRSVEETILPVTRELGISVTAYGVFSRGLLSTTTKVPDSSKGDHRALFPRFQGENFQQNLRLVEVLRPIAVRKGCTLAQLALAWVLAQGNDIIPLVGARKTDRLDRSRRRRPDLV